MKSLTFKMAAAFLVVGLVGVTFSALLTQQGTSRAFDHMVWNKIKNDYKELLLSYYQENGNWEGVDQYVQTVNMNSGNVQFPVQEDQNVSPDSQDQRQQPEHQPPFTYPFVFAGADGRVIIPGGNFQFGDLIDLPEIDEEDKLYSGDELVGAVISLGGNPQRQPYETLYLERAKQTILLAALGASMVALLLGVFLSRTMIRPLRELTVASSMLADGNLDFAVPVRSRDEVGELAESFNQMREKLARSNRIRHQMTADIAHDLRSPLTVISGYIEALRDGDLKPTPSRFDIVLKEVHQLQRLVEDLRTLSLADAGELPLNLHPFLINELLDAALEIFCKHAETNNLQVNKDIAENLPELLIDPDRISQVLDNLLMNAVCYTQSGGEISLTAYATAEHVVIKIRDTGQGIPTEELGLIFERFYRADKSRNEAAGGSGLGLAISKSIVELHGGEIFVKSELGTGSEFSMKLPLPKEKP